MFTNWREPWWVWNADSAGIGDWAYRSFNLSEGIVWLTFSGLVLIRWYRNRRSWGEWSYALAFATFGWTDFREADAQSGPLLLFKGFVLAWLMVIRHRATRVWYPHSKLY